MLTFDAETHRYAWDGQPVPGVTQVIRSAVGDPFARIARDVLERKRQIGHAAHKAAELDAAGMLNEATVHPAVLPYLSAWRAFRRETGFEVVASEEKLYHTVLGYAGQLDFWGTFPARPGAAVVDLKTGLPGPMAAMQTAAYLEMVLFHYAGLEGEQRRFALRALPTGRYKLEEYTNPGDWRDFLACLAVHRLKERIENE